jgi:hypothetical protein
MRTLILILLTACISYFSFSQTYDAEMKNASKKFEEGKITQQEYQNLSRKWNQIIKDFGGYPELPYDKERKLIQYEFIQDFPDTDKEAVFNRVLEWAAINFGSLDAVLHYKDFASGKIILKGVVPIYQIVDIYSFFTTQEKLLETNCHQTYIFTLKENKMKLQIQNIGYEQKFYNYQQTSSSSSLYTTDYSIHDLYPITDFPTDQWKNKLSQLVSTDRKIRNLKSNLFNYIKSYEKDYEF